MNKMDVEDFNDDELIQEYNKIKRELECRNINKLIVCLKCGKDFKDDDYQKLCSDCIVV